VCRIDAHDQGPVTQPRELQAGGGGKTGLPDASFAAEKKDAHTFILPPAPRSSGRHAEQVLMLDIHVTAGQAMDALAKSLDRLIQ